MQQTTQLTTNQPTIKPVPPAMRVNVMFTLKHVAHDQAHAETYRLLLNAANRLAMSGEAMKVGDTLILTDEKGNRVGVLDVFKD